jgi:hypothetical protein
VNFQGSCHCGNLTFTLAWPDAVPMPARACGCSFCRKHGGVWTSHPQARLAVRVRDPAQVSTYGFGTRTADFHICTRCGVVPLVSCEAAGRLYAVVNVNALDDMDESLLERSSVDFDDEAGDVRIERRRRRWIADVRMA